MRFVTAYGLVKKANEKIEKRKLWEIWLVNFSNMTKDTYESFDDFYDRITNPYVCTKTDEEIMSEFGENRNEVSEQDGDI
jgi:hypothetical protein